MFASLHQTFEMPENCEDDGTTWNITSCASSKLKMTIMDLVNEFYENKFNSMERECYAQFVLVKCAKFVEDCVGERKLPFLSLHRERVDIVLMIQSRVNLFGEILAYLSDNIKLKRFSKSFLWGLSIYTHYVCAVLIKDFMNSLVANVSRKFVVAKFKKHRKKKKQRVKDRKLVECCICLDDVVRRKTSGCKVEQCSARLCKGCRNMIKGNQCPLCRQMSLN